MNVTGAVYHHPMLDVVWFVEGEEDATFQPRPVCVKSISVLINHSISTWESSGRTLHRFILRIIMGG